MKRYSPWWIAGCTLLGLIVLTAGLRAAEALLGPLWTRVHPGATLVLAIDSAHAYHSGLPAGEARSRTLARLRERLEPLTERALFRTDGDRVEVTLPRDVLPERAARQLTRSGRLALQLVDDGSDYMKQLATFAVTATHDAEIGRDGWSEAESGASHADVFLSGSDPKKLAEVVRLFPTPIPSDHAIVFGRRDATEDRPADWRSYYVLARTDLDGESISEAEAAWSSEAERPEVALVFTDEGAKTFEAVTARAVGRKLAILLEGVVTAAPVIESKISGGRARITMGGATDPKTLMEDTKDLVSVMRAGAMPAPVTLVETRAPR